MGSTIGSILSSWGLNGCLGMAGVYLVVSSISGALIPIPRVFRAKIVLRSKQKRLLTGIFGLVLALPVIAASYLQMFRNTSASLTSPTIDVHVKTAGENQQSQSVDKPAPKPISENVRAESIGTISMLSAGPAFLSVAGLNRAASDDSSLEHRGLEEDQFLRLAYGGFDGRVYVYVSDIHAFVGRSDLYVFVPGAGWPQSGRLYEKDFQSRIRGLRPDSIHKLSFKGKGESLRFSFNGGNYRLVVSEVYAVLIGRDKIAISIYRD